MAAATSDLAAAGVASPRVDAELLAAHVFDVPRGRLALCDAAPADLVGSYADAVRRRSAREPVQHITGVAYFRRLELAVCAGVFLPRPETELLVDWLLDELGDREPPVVVDLGTGSGAIALAVATELAGARVHAVEADEAAYRLARRNVDAVGAAVDVHLADATSWAPRQRAVVVDAVVANPPYVPAGAEVDVETGHDPARALYAGPDGLDGIRLVAGASARLLRPGGVLACEHDAGQGEAAPGLLRALGGWTDIRDHADLAGRPRYVTATRRTADR